MNFEQEAYEIDDLWKPENIDQADIERINTLSDHIPYDVKSILDVGCGGGIFVNHLISYGNRFERLCGVDRSNAALKYVKTEKKQASITKLPFNDKEFDMVASLEVIEHLPVDVYDKALNEIFRISKKYILICVPYIQDLKKSLVKCPICFTRYNPDFHMRSFDYHSIYNLFNKYNCKCLTVFYIHPTHYYKGISLLKKNLQFYFFGNKRPWYAICPVCGYKDGLYKNRVRSDTDNKSIFDDLKNTILFKYWPHKVTYNWIAGLYQK